MMIDKRKNALYKNTIYYISTENNIKSFTLYSHHGICTKRFEQFMNAYIKQNINDFKRLTEEWGTQETISNDRFCY